MTWHLELGGTGCILPLDLLSGQINLLLFFFSFFVQENRYTARCLFHVDCESS